MANMTEQKTKIRPVLIGMKKGQSFVFPIERLKSVRTQASEISMIFDRTYKTETDRIERTITVTRTK